MTVEPLLEHLRHEGEEEARRRLAAARARAEGIVAQARERLEVRRRTMIEAHTRQLSARRERACAESAQRASHATLAARERFVERVLRELRAIAADNIGDARFATRARHDLQRAIDYLPDGAVVVRCAPTLAAAIRECAPTLPGRSLSITEDASLAPGIVVESSDGRVRVETTIEQHLTADRPQIAIALLRQAASRFP